VAAAERAADAATRLAENGSNLSEIGDFALSSGLTLLLVAAIVLIWKLYSPIRRIVEGGRFAIKIGSFELTAKEGADQIASHVEDLQKKVASLLADRAANTVLASADSAPVSTQRTKSLRILWVDDQPRGNAFGISGLESLGHAVDTAKSNAEARLVLGNEKYDVVISDIGRPEGRDAGLDLLEELRAKSKDRPLAVFSTSESIRRNYDRINKIEPIAMTNSFPELLSAIITVAKP
jgi:CheY-like chemotaxis protein